MRKQVEVLEYHTGFLADLPDIGIGPHQWITVDKNLAAGKGFESVDRAEQRTFSGSRWTDDKNNFTFVHRKIHALEGHDDTEILFGAANVNHYSVIAHVFSSCLPSWLPAWRESM